MKIQNMTIQDLKDEIIRQEIILITNRIMLWHKSKHEELAYLHSEQHVVNIINNKDYQETEAYIEGVLKRI